MATMEQTRARLSEGLFIPAHPLALTEKRFLDEMYQRSLTRYYLAAGVDGIAVGVHTTQFEIHDPSCGLYRPVLELCRETMMEHESRTGIAIVKIAGVIGRTEQASREADLCRTLGYDAVLLGVSAFPDATHGEILEHCRTIAAIHPVIGFYLQPAVGGRNLDYSFWRAFTEIPEVVAIKIAPFNRYQTMEVARAVADSGRAADIHLYTGNDDHILQDLLTPLRFGNRTIRIAGGLLGHWAYWTHAAVRIFHLVKKHVRERTPAPEDLLIRAGEITDSNGAIFDAAHDFTGCLPGIQHVLFRDGLLRTPHCVDPAMRLSNGQEAEIDRIYASYPHLRDDVFIAQHRDDWLR